MRRPLLALVFVFAVGAAPAASADIENVQNAQNVQEGSNFSDVDGGGMAGSGDFVGGQVVGVTSDGESTVDATNVSRDVTGRTGETEFITNTAAFVGLNVGIVNVLTVDLQPALTSDISFVNSAQNVLEGDQRRIEATTGGSFSGDAVGGQVTGAVTTSGARSNLVLDNVSEDIDLDTGLTRFRNDPIVRLSGDVLGGNDDD